MRARFVIYAFCLLIAACGGDSGPKIASVRITPQQVQFASLGLTTQLTATAYDKNGEAIPDIEFTWMSANSGVAPVSDTGVVTAQGNGVTGISAQASSGHGSTVSVAIQQLPASVQISPDAWDRAQAWIGARRQFTASVSDANGHAIAGANAAVTWGASSNLVSVDDAGLATVRDANGNATTSVTAQAGSVSGEVTFTPLYNVADTPGYMYTSWFARTDDTPVALVNGKLTLPHAPNEPGVEFYGNVSNVANLAPVWPNSTVEKFQYEGNRIGLLTDMANGAGTLRVFDRAEEMTILALGNALDFELEGNRIGVLLEGGQFRVKDGTHGPWTTLVATGAVAFKLDGQLIGVLLENGTVQVKIGINGQWYLLDDSNIVDFAIENDVGGGQRVVFLRADGLLRGKDGFNNPDLVDLASDVVDFKIAGDRIAATQGNGEFRAKDGIFGAWTTLESVPLRQYELSGLRIATLTEAGRFRVKDGMHGAWTVLSESDATAIHLQGDYIGFVNAAGVLRVKTGIHGAWTDSHPMGAGVTQFRLIVDNPVPPKRTTTASYVARQQDCKEITGPNDCYWVSGFAVPVPYYGVFCGGGRPEDTNAAFGFGSIDTFDEMCVHHDKISSWYPEWYVILTDEFGIGDPLNFTGSCIVRYGLIHGRLTHNGELLADGTSDDDKWADAWSKSGMPNLWDALDNYFTYTAGCVSGNLSRFDDVTDAHND